MHRYTETALTEFLIGRCKTELGYLYMHINTHIYSHMCIYTHTNTAHRYTDMYTRMQDFGMEDETRSLNTYTYTCTWMLRYRHTHIHIYVYTHTRIVIPRVRDESIAEPCMIILVARVSVHYMYLVSTHALLSYHNRCIQVNMTLCIYLNMRLYLLGSISDSSTVRVYYHAELVFVHVHRIHIYD